MRSVRSARCGDSRVRTEEEHPPRSWLGLVATPRHEHTPRSWPGWSRPFIVLAHPRREKTWMPGSRPGMTGRVVMAGHLSGPPHAPSTVMAGLVPAIHAFRRRGAEARMPGPRPGMTVEGG